MKYIFTKHIKDRIQQRGFSRNEIISIVLKPDKILEGKFGKKIAIRKNIKVIYTEEDNNLILITAYKFKNWR